MKRTYSIVIEPSAVKELDKVPVDVFNKIDRSISELAHNPRPFGVKKLRDNLHRIRIGDWRVLYAILNRESRLVILRVARRNEKTYK